MKICPKCGAQLDDGAAFCTACGTQFARPAAAQPTAGQPAAPQPAGAPMYYVDPNDHTAEFDPCDISDNKVFAMAPYLASWIGVIVALLASHDSRYANFHVRQVLKMEMVSVLLGVIALVLCWTVIAPIAAGICYVVLLVVRVIGFFNVCGGKAKELPIIASLGFMK